MILTTAVVVRGAYIVRENASSSFLVYRGCGNKDPGSDTQFVGVLCKVSLD
jgi:hypothetical protein